MEALLASRPLSKWIGLRGCLAGIAAMTAATDQPTAASQPVERQPGGKDVTWVPTCAPVIMRMLDMAQVSPADYVIDLGSGDGRMVIAAAKRGARVLGVEYDQDKVDLSIRNAAEAGVGDRAAFIKADLFEIDFSQATVLTMFLLPDINLRLRPKILDMKPGTRVATNTFDFADWEADQKHEVPPPECTAHCWALFWMVPAKVGGTWRTEYGELSFEQTFQMVSGTLTSGGVTSPITDGKLRGDEITITVGERTFSGHVHGDVIEGMSGPGATGVSWRAIRI